MLDLVPNSIYLWIGIEYALCDECISIHEASIFCRDVSVAGMFLPRFLVNICGK